VHLLAYCTGWSKSLCAPDDYNTECYLPQSDCLAADRQGQGNTRLILTPSFIPNSNYVIMVSDWNCLKYFCVFLYCNYQVHRDFLITLYIQNNWLLCHLSRSCIMTAAVRIRLKSKRWKLFLYRILSINGFQNWNLQKRYLQSILTHLLNAAERPTWKGNRFSASQEIPRSLWNPKVHHRIYKCPPTVPTLSTIHTSPATLKTEFSAIQYYVTVNAQRKAHASTRRHCQRSRNSHSTNLTASLRYRTTVH
jgi:hypothetical protein